MRLTFAALFMLAILSGCGSNEQHEAANMPTSLKQVPAVRLNFRYEADVPPPADVRKPAADDRVAAVQSDFDQNRPQESLFKTIASPDSKRVLAIYNRVGDQPSEFRLDMYSVEGRPIRRITPESMAVHFPDTILWSPDSSSVAFVAMLRMAQPIPEGSPQPGGSPHSSNSNSKASPAADDKSNANANTDSAAEPVADTTPAGEAIPPAQPVLTFRSEQLYLANADGDGLKPITQNEGLIYFYYVWSPDSEMLAALAATSREWLYLSQRADLNGEIFVPVGRPRLIEKNGRERRLDDALTAVQPVWSPDSSKVAAAFDKQIRIYDATGDSPTQAAIPLKNYLLISSRAYDQEQQKKLETENAPQDANAANVVNTNAAKPEANSAAPLPPSALPDESTLVSFNPITLLSWPEDDMLYFQTAFIKRMKNEADSVTSFPRWHRLILTPQAPPEAK